MTLLLVLGVAWLLIGTLVALVLCRSAADGDAVQLQQLAAVPADAALHLAA